jgi:integrase
MTLIRFMPRLAKHSTNTERGSHHLHLRHAADLLRSSSVAPSTYSAYTSAIIQFFAYCHNLPPHTHHRQPHPSAAWYLDTCVRRYIVELFVTHSGRKKQLAVNTVYGLYLVQPEMRGLLKRSEQLLHGWGRLTPAVSHPPLTWPLTVLIAITLARSGLVDCAIAILVAFDGLLRVGELVAIRVQDVSTLSDPRVGTASTASRHFANLAAAGRSRVCIRLAKTKTGKNQWCELYTPEIGALLTRLIAHREPSSLVFSFPSAQRAAYFRQAMSQACTSLNLTQPHYTPHSLRHGGATHAHTHLSQSIEHIMHRGRWQSNTTCRSYIQSGAAALLTQELPSSVNRLASAMLVDWSDTLSHLCFRRNS